MRFSTSFETVSDWVTHWVSFSFSFVASESSISCTSTHWLICSVTNEIWLERSFTRSLIFYNKQQNHQKLHALVVQCSLEYTDTWTRFLRGIYSTKSKVSILKIYLRLYRYWKFITVPTKAFVVLWIIFSFSDKYQQDSSTWAKSKVSIAWLNSFTPLNSFIFLWASVFTRSSSSVIRCRWWL